MVGTVARERLGCDVLAIGILHREPQRNWVLMAHTAACQPLLSLKWRVSSGDLVGDDRGHPRESRTWFSTIRVGPVGNVVDGRSHPRQRSLISNSFGQFLPVTNTRFFAAS
jgi:hypothetical protein